MLNRIFYLVSLIAKTTIPPFSARVLALKARKEIDGTGLILLEYLRHRNLFIPPCLVNIEGGLTHVFAINITATTLQLKPNTLICNTWTAPLPIIEFDIPSFQVNSANVNSKDDLDHVYAALQEALETA